MVVSSNQTLRYHNIGCHFAQFIQIINYAVEIVKQANTRLKYRNKIGEQRDIVHLFGGLNIYQSSLSHKLVYNGSFQTLYCCHLFGIQPVWPKICVA